MPTQKAPLLATLASRLEALDDDFLVFSAAPPAKPALGALAKKLGVPLRDDHRALIAAYSSLAILASEAVWPRPVEFDILPAWQFCFGIEVFGIAPATAPALDVVVQTTLRRCGGKRTLVAAMRRVGESGCVGYDQRGTLFEWEPGGAPVAAKGATLVDILLDWLTRLEHDKATIKATPRKAPEAAAGHGKAGGAKTVAQWVDRLGGEDTRDDAAAALMKEAPKLRGKVIAELVASIDEDDTDPMWSLAALEADPRAVDAVLAFATTGKADVRTTALGILGVLDDKPKRAVAVLLGALGAKDEDVVAEAAESLGSYSDASAVEPLKKALVKAQRNPRWVYGVLGDHLMTALAAAGPGRPDVIDVLTANLTPKESEYAALPAFRALVAMGAKAGRAVPKLEAVIASGSPYLATLARHAMGAITGDYTPHLKALATAAKSKDPAVKAVAGFALTDARGST